VSENISDREQLLLKKLIEHYIRQGQPVGSTTLARESNLDLSAATIRNVIADLEKLGLVHSPHTSAGRVPTARGYRLFIDELLTIRPPSEQDIQQLRERFSEQADTKTLLSSTSQLLSGITKMAGVVMLPNQERSILQQIEFLRLGEKRILAILVFGKNEVENRILNTSKDYKPEELQRIANCLNQEFLGKDIARVRHELLLQMQNAKDDADRIMIQAIEIANRVFQSDAKPKDYVLAGEANLLGYEDMADVGRLKQLFDIFNEKQAILHLFDLSLHAPGVQIFIGQESGLDALEGCSVVTATYANKDQVLGALGVIGPTRMEYDRVIPLVDATAKLLGNMLS